MKNLLLLSLAILAVSCSPKTQQKLMKLLAKTPNLNYQKPTNYSTLNRYQKDAVYLFAVIQQAYPRLETKISESEFKQKGDELMRKLDHTTNDLDFEIELQKLMACLKDGHSYLSNGPNLYQKTSKFPWFLYRESDKWVVGNLDKGMDSLIIGSEVISINKRSIKEIEGLIGSFESGENNYRTNLHFARKGLFAAPKFWQAIGVTTGTEPLQLVVSKNGVLTDIEIQSKNISDIKGYRVWPKSIKYPYTNQQNGGFFQRLERSDNFAYLQMNTCLDLLTTKKEMSNYVNFFIRPFALAFMKHERKDARNFGVVLQSLFKDIEKNKIQNLIIDLRYNGGGSEKLGKQLIWYLTNQDTIKGITEYFQVSDYARQRVKSDYKMYNRQYHLNHGKDMPDGEVNITQEFINNSYFSDITQKNSPYLLDATISKFKGKVYVLVGANTFSAAQVLATTLADNKLATLVGTPVGNKPTTQTGFSTFKLPNTKKILAMSYTYFERPDKSKNNEVTLYPHVEIHPTFTEFLEGKNQPFDYIVNEIRNGKYSDK